MEEAFLHFIWKFQPFNTRDLLTESGQKILVLQPGSANIDAGPDFKNAKIQIGEIIWNGSVEIHIQAKDWYNHKHHQDEASNNVVLHVVWKNDASIERKDNTVIPTLELKNLVDQHPRLNYKQLFEPGEEILCRRFTHKIKPITVLSMKDKVLAQRLESKSEKIFREIALTNYDWEEITWRVLCRNFGFKTNAHPFYELGKSMPLKILKKEAHSQETVEGLLFGQAGFLEEEYDDPYFLALKNEYTFGLKKHSLERWLDLHQWKFLRLRPANFPTIRIAQLAALVSSQENLLSFFIHYRSIKELLEGLKTSQSSYWQKHYLFGKPTKSTIGKLGVSSVDNILINRVTPLLLAYGIHKDMDEMKERALELLASVKAVKNSITNKWMALSMEIKSAFDSQAIIEFNNEYCMRKRCLSCSIGTDVIRSS